MKMIKKVFLVILIVSILGFFFYWGLEMSQFANGVKSDTVKIEEYRSHK